MNIFVVNSNPIVAARSLPDRHVTKMIVESAQMLSIVFSEHYWNIGEVRKVDGTPFKTKRGTFKNHPCTKWVAENINHCEWLIFHAIGLCNEFNLRYGHSHGLHQSLNDVLELFSSATKNKARWALVKQFARAMPDNLKYDENISDVQAYRLYLNTKPWVKDNYLRLPSRKPTWIS